MHVRTITLFAGLTAAAGFAATSPTLAATYPAMPSCQAVGRAIESAIGPVARVEDDTAGADQIAAKSSGVPYKVLRACAVYVPGHRTPLSVSFDAPVSRAFLNGMSRMSRGMGLKVQKLDGSGYGDLAYLIPQVGGGNAVNALVGNVDIALTTWAGAKDAKLMASHLVALID